MVTLGLQYNDISSVPTCLLELPSLRELNLSHNKLSDIPSTNKWSSALKTLDLSHNKITSLPSRSYASAIRSFNLSNNNLHSVPLCVCAFATLRSLDLSNNPDILTLPAELGRLNNIEQLNLSGLRDLHDPPKNILRETEDCMRYLSNKLRNARPFYRMKLMLVGREDRGKTTLVARLQNKPCPILATAGVEVSDWVYRQGIARQSFQFSIWDFGGQEEYYATHQCFLSQRSLYLLLFNLVHPEEEVLQELKPWLSNIALRAPRSCVLIVGTHLDKVAHRESVNPLLWRIRDLASTYFNRLEIKQVIPVALKNQLENITVLKDAIYNSAVNYKIGGRQPVMGQLVPASYHALDRQLLKLQHEVHYNAREPILHAEEFKTLVQQMNLSDIQDEKELRTATLFLCNVGSLLHYDDRSHGLHELYFIDPSWLCQMMAKVVTVREGNHYIKKGILLTKNIHQIFKDERFPLHYFEQYISLLDKFEIALLLDNQRILIPSMLPKEKPSSIQLSKCLSRYIRYIKINVSDTPPGFWSRLLSRIMHSIQEVRLVLDKCTPRSLEESFSILDSSTYDSFDTRLMESTNVSIPQQLLPNFRPALPFNPVDTLDYHNVSLEYWHSGLSYISPQSFFQIESLFDLQPRIQEEGVYIVTSRNKDGMVIMCKLVDLVVSLLDDWYPGVWEGSHEGLEQMVPCCKCISEEAVSPCEFKIKDCIQLIKDNKYSAYCTQHGSIPLAELVPDLMLSDIRKDFLLEESQVEFLEEESSLLGSGSFSKVYRGRYKQKPVAVKTYTAERMVDAFSELRKEAILLQKCYHPCLVCMVGVLIHHRVALVLEKAPLGSLDKILIEKQQPIDRVVIHRMAVQVAAALKFLHSNGIIFRDLKASNVLVWSLDPESLCHCKVTDFGIASLLFPIGSRGLCGAKSFIAPEVLHSSVYDHRADIFSFGMLLYQMLTRRYPYHNITTVRIDAAVRAGERPGLEDVPAVNTAYYYLTRLMQRCWNDDPIQRPPTGDIIWSICNSTFQSIMSIHQVQSRFSLRHACVVTPNDFALAGKRRNSSELWVCCDGIEGTEINVYTVNSMVKIRKSFIKNNQVQAICVCGGNVWVASRPGIGVGAIDIFNITTRELVRTVKLHQDTSVSCIACSERKVYCGTIDGYCQSFSHPTYYISSSKYISEYPINGLATTRDNLWVSVTNYIYFLNLETLDWEGSVVRPEYRGIFIGQLYKSFNASLVWSAHLGATIISVWDSQRKFHKVDVDTSKHLQSIYEIQPDQDAAITAVAPSLDTVWVGLATGHILVFHIIEEQYKSRDIPKSVLHLVTWYHCYSQFVRFLVSIPSDGPCYTEQCMVVSGAKGFQQAVPHVLEEKKTAHAETGTLILWEAFPAKMAEQVKQIEERSEQFLKNHKELRTVVQTLDFKDGINVLSEEENSPTVTGPDDTLYQDLAEQVIRFSTEADNYCITCSKVSNFQEIIGRMLQEANCNDNEAQMQSCITYRRCDSGECIKIQTQAEFDAYMQLQKKPTLHLSVS